MEREMSDEMKPCPFCGSEFAELQHGTTTDGIERWWVECECGCTLDDFYLGKDYAIAAWNSRAVIHYE